MIVCGAIGDYAGSFVGVIAAFALIAVVAKGSTWLRRPKSVHDLLRRHFEKVPQDQIEVHSREFPYRVSVDAHLAVREWIELNCRVDAVVGIPITNTFMTSVGIAALLSQRSEESGETLYPTALEYESFDVGADSPATCVKHALWFAECQLHKLAILWTSETSHSGCGFQTKLRLDIASVGQRGSAAAEQFFRHVETAIGRATTYRGKILSLEVSTDYGGHSSGITVHRLRPVAREDVILSEATVRLLERNIIRFVEQRPELAKLGMPTKKGLLLYGPPGTGKTHTIHYLIGALPGHTTLLVTAEQVGMLDEYMTLARLLQPSVVVMEDVDLIGRDREHMEVGCASLLNRLLNEMDGLRADAEILFLLTTNRPESLERALAARPGRVDQAIEFPLPDEAGRRRLIRLYAAGAEITDDVVSHTARVTEDVSASFIKELMRRAIQFHLECRTDGEKVQILQNDVDQAIDELLFAGGSLNRALLGANESESDG